MAIDRHDHIVANPENVVGATGSGLPETREGHDSTQETWLARLRKKRYLHAAAGATALVLFSGAAYALTRGEDAPARPNHSTAVGGAAPTPEASPSRAFETKDLTINQMSVPETLDPPTFAEMVTNVGKSIEYAVNKGDAELVRRLIPGGLTGKTGTLQPGQFELRGSFIKGFRESSEGTGNDNPDDPQNERYYAWGFSMDLVEPISHFNSEPKNVNSFTGLVRITMGDLPPLDTLTTNELNMEPPHTLEVEAEFTRYATDENGTRKALPNIGGTANGGWKELKGEGWALASVGQLYPIPEIMAANHKHHGFEELPELFKES